MSFDIRNLKPEILWNYFDKIRRIPHGSENETVLREAIIAWAKKSGCETEVDKTGNCVVLVKASAGCENADTVVLQGHIDMVCEKNQDTDFDFEKDEIKLLREDDWLTADGTTLGADNGIGVAAALSFMDDSDTVHGPLELLFTVSEETGLTGALNLEPGFIKGKILLNLDAEELDSIYIGCAGGRDTHIYLPVTKVTAPSNTTSYKLKISGLRGGHSGLDIISNRGNAVKLLARTLFSLSEKGEFCLSSLSGGDKHNAIPREAIAEIVVPNDLENILKETVAGNFDQFKDQFGNYEPNLSINLTPAQPLKEVFDNDTRDSLLSLLIALPSGVISMERALSNTVETSTNISAIKSMDEKIMILCSSRSSNLAALSPVVSQLKVISRLVNADAQPDDGYPAWQSNPDSSLVAEAKKAWVHFYGNNPPLEVLHAGLECGIIGEKYPGMEMIAFGPTIKNPHSPDEKVLISSVARFFDFTKAFLKELAQK